MSGQRLKDTRKSRIASMEEAAKLFDEIAGSELKIARAEAMAEVRIATIKEQTAAKIAMIDPDLEAKRGLLSEFIDLNRHLFERPRKHKTSMGSFGLHSASNLEYSNKKACTEFLVDQGMTNCFETTHKPVAAGIKNALEANVKIPGVVHKTGLIIKYIVDKALMKDAQEVD